MTEDVLISDLLSRWSCALGPHPDCEVVNAARLFCRIRSDQGVSQGLAYILKEVGDIEPRDGARLQKVVSDLALLEYLARRGIPVALPALTDQGGLYARSGSRFFTLSPVLPVHYGDPAVRTDRLFFNLGAALGRLHRALAQYPGEIRSWTMDLPSRILKEAVPVLERRLGGEECARLDHSLEALRAPFQGLLSGLPAQPIHGDCHGGNVLFDGERVSGFIDLDHLPTGPRIYDLGYFSADWAKNRFQKAEELEAWLAALPALLEGYAQEVKLTSHELDALVYILPGVQLIFAAWFFEPVEKPELARFNLDAFYWIEQNLARIQAAIRSTRATPI